MLTFSVNRRGSVRLFILVTALFCRLDAADINASDLFIESLLTTMGPEEKAGQMILVYNSPLRFLRDHKVGGVLVMQSMLKEPCSLRVHLRRAQKKLPIPLLITIDQEGGAVNRLSPLTGWKKTPSAKELAGWGPDSIRVYTRRVAAKLRRIGINMNLAPVVDPSENSEGLETYMGVKKRSFGKNAEQIAPPALAFIKGFSDRKVLCVAKHFPGYDVTTNSDLESSFSSADSPAIDGYAMVFRTIVPLTAGIMMTSIRYRSMSDTPAVLSSSMVSRARSISGDNIILTDDLWGASLRSYILPDSTIRPSAYPDSAFARLVECAVRAGNDMLMITYPQKVPLMITTITAMAGSDADVHAHVDAAARRILTAKKKLGLIGK